MKDQNEKHPLWDIMVVVILVAAIPWWAFAFQVIWSWFLAPLGVQRIGMAHAFGISLVLKMLYGQPVQNKNDGWTSTERDTHKVLTAVLLPLVSLGLAAIAHSLM